MGKKKIINLFIKLKFSFFMKKCKRFRTIIREGERKIEIITRRI